MRYQRDCRQMSIVKPEKEPIVSDLTIGVPSEG
jgi:hypothetical protein